MSSGAPTLGTKLLAYGLLATWAGCLLGAGIGQFWPVMIFAYVSGAIGSVQLARLKGYRPWLGMFVMLFPFGPLIVLALPYLPRSVPRIEEDS